jgi:hypothetical protein
MIEFIPYFAGIITIMFGIGFILALNKFKEYNRNE